MHRVLASMKGMLCFLYFFQTYPLLHGGRRKLRARKGGWAQRASCGMNGSANGNTAQNIPVLFWTSDWLDTAYSPPPKSPTTCPRLPHTHTHTHTLFSSCSGTKHICCKQCLAEGEGWQMENVGKWCDIFCFCRGEMCTAGLGLCSV